jgi:hypothetical protein
MDVKRLQLGKHSYISELIHLDRVYTM